MYLISIGLVERESRIDVGLRCDKKAQSSESWIHDLGEKQFFKPLAAGNRWRIDFLPSKDDTTLG